MSAAMLRRLELEDWDKERMKNFYLASYGGLKWFEFMENALHNPLFITTRGWTDPVENWIGRQQTFPNDIPRTIVSVHHHHNAIQAEHTPCCVTSCSWQVMRHTV